MTFPLLAESFLRALVILLVLCAIIYAQDSNSPGHELSRGERSVDAQTQPENLPQWGQEGKQNSGQGNIQDPLTVTE